MKWGLCIMLACITFSIAAQQHSPKEPADTHKNAILLAALLQKDDTMEQAALRIKQLLTNSTTTEDAKIKTIMENFKSKYGHSYLFDAVAAVNSNELSAWFIRQASQEPELKAETIQAIKIIHQKFARGEFGKTNPKELLSLMEQCRQHNIIEREQYGQILKATAASLPIPCYNPTLNQMENDFPF